MNISIPLIPAATRSRFPEAAAFADSVNAALVENTDTREFISDTLTPPGKVLNACVFACVHDDGDSDDPNAGMVILIFTEWSNGELNFNGTPTGKTILKIAQKLAAIAGFEEYDCSTGTTVFGTRVFEYWFSKNH